MWAAYIVTVRLSADARQSGWGRRPAVLSDRLSSPRTSKVALAERPERADYDPVCWVSKADAIASLASARKIIADFRAISEAARKDFLTLLLFRDRKS